MGSKPYNHYIPEVLIPNAPLSIPSNALNLISNQSKNNILKIINQKNENGTGFFCLIPFPDKRHLLPTLITNNHVLNENDIEKGKKIKFSSEVGNYEIEIDNLRKCYTNEKYDTTIIEIKTDDKVDINKFLEIDENIFDDNAYKTFSKSSVYIIHYPKGIQNEISFGKIKDISDSLDIYHQCNTLPGSSGGPIINSINYKIIGIHKGSEEGKKLNLGTLLKLPIENFNEKFSNIIGININTNEIRINDSNIEINYNNKINKNDLDDKVNNPNNENNNLKEIKSPNNEFSLFNNEIPYNINNNDYNNMNNSHRNFDEYNNNLNKNDKKNKNSISH